MFFVFRAYTGIQSAGLATFLLKRFLDGLIDPQKKYKLKTETSDEYKRNNTRKRHKAQQKTRRLRAYIGFGIDHQIYWPAFSFPSGLSVAMCGESGEAGSQETTVLMRNCLPCSCV